MLNANWKQEGGGKKYRLKPYWGNPAVRNFRGSGGSLGIIEAQLAPLLYSTLTVTEYGQEKRNDSPQRHKEHEEKFNT